MKLSFETKELRAICESQIKAERTYGLEFAKRLRALLADLDSAETLQEIPSEELWESSRTGVQDFEAPLTDRYLLRMCVNHSSLARSSDERIDRSSVRRLKILEIQLIEVIRG